MDISAGLIAKVLAGAAAVSATASGIVYKDPILNYLKKFITSEVDELNKNLENLGLPTNCKFEKNSNSKNCEKLTDATLKAINFEGKAETITGTIDHADKVNLKLEKIEETNVFPSGIKVIFENEEAITSSGSTNGLNIDWKKNTNPEYKIEGGKLKRAWDITKLAGKIGLTSCPTDESTTPKECTFGEKINLFKDSSNSVVGATVSENTSKKIKFEKDQEGYNQGFKLTVETAVTISGGTQKPANSSVTQIEATTYEIKEQTVDGQKHWFLSKKPA